MTISSELFLAILSMDAYNRGYGAGLADSASADPDGLGEVGQIGNAQILGRADIGVSAEQYTNWQAAGFYAVAYTVNGVAGIANGTTVISYRGTDKPLAIPFWSDTGSDIWNGYGTAIGDPTSYQARLAADFFQSVTGTQNGDPRLGQPILTGHSLGGVLAGLSPHRFARCAPRLGRRRDATGAAA